MAKGVFRTPVFLFGSTRSGVGKSTILAHLAVYFHGRGKKVAIVDTNHAFPLQLRGMLPKSIPIESYADLAEISTQISPRFRRSFYFTNTDRLSIFPANKIGDAGRFLEDTALRDFFLQVRSSFDLILLNLPPGTASFHAFEAFAGHGHQRDSFPAIGVMTTDTDLRSLAILDHLFRSRPSLQFLLPQQLLVLFNRVPGTLEEQSIGSPSLSPTEIRSLFRLPLSISIPLLQEFSLQAMSPGSLVMEENNPIRGPISRLARILQDLTEGNTSLDTDHDDLFHPCLDPALLSRFTPLLQRIQKQVAQRLFITPSAISVFLEQSEGRLRVRVRLTRKSRPFFGRQLEIRLSPPGPKSLPARHTDISFPRSPVLPSHVRFLWKERPSALTVHPYFHFDDRFSERTRFAPIWQETFVQEFPVYPPVPGFLPPASIPGLISFHQAIGVTRTSGRYEPYRDITSVNLTLCPSLAKSLKVFPLSDLGRPFTISELLFSPTLSSRTNLHIKTSLAIGSYFYPRKVLENLPAIPSMFQRNWALVDSSAPMDVETSLHLSALRHFPQPQLSFLSSPEKNSSWRDLPLPVFFSIRLSRGATLPLYHEKAFSQLPRWEFFPFAPAAPGSIPHPNVDMPGKPPRLPFLPAASAHPGLTQPSSCPTFPLLSGQILTRDTPVPLDLTQEQRVIVAKHLTFQTPAPPPRTWRPDLSPARTIPTIRRFPASSQMLPYAFAQTLVPDSREAYPESFSTVRPCPAWKVSVPTSRMEPRTAPPSHFSLQGVGLHKSLTITQNVSPWKTLPPLDQRHFLSTRRWRSIFQTRNPLQRIRTYIGSQRGLTQSFASLSSPVPQTILTRRALRSHLAESPPLTSRLMLETVARDLPAEVPCKPSACPNFATRLWDSPLLDRFFRKPENALSPSLKRPRLQKKEPSLFHSSRGCEARELPPEHRQFFGYTPREEWFHAPVTSWIHLVRNQAPWLPLSHEAQTARVPLPSFPVLLRDHGPGPLVFSPFHPPEFLPYHVPANDMPLLHPGRNEFRVSPPVHVPAKTRLSLFLEFASSLPTPHFSHPGLDGETLTFQYPLLGFTMNRGREKISPRSYDCWDMLDLHLHERLQSAWQHLPLGNERILFRRQGLTRFGWVFYFQLHLESRLPTTGRKGSRTSPGRLYIERLEGFPLGASRVSVLLEAAAKAQIQVRDVTRGRP